MDKESSKLNDADEHSVSPPRKPRPPKPGRDDPKRALTEKAIMVVDAETGELLPLNTRTAVERAAVDSELLTTTGLDYAVDEIAKLHPHSSAQSATIHLMLDHLRQKQAAKLKEEQVTELLRQKELKEEWFVWRQRRLKEDHQYAREKYAYTTELKKQIAEAETLAKAREFGLLFQHNRSLMRQVKRQPQTVVGRPPGSPGSTRRSASPSTRATRTSGGLAQPSFGSLGGSDSMASTASASTPRAGASRSRTAGPGSRGR